MSDPVFFPPASGLTLADIVRLTQAHPPAGADLGGRFQDVASLDRAGPLHICVLQAEQPHGPIATRAGACFVAPDRRSDIPAGSMPLVTATPLRAFVAVVAAFHPLAAQPRSAFATRGISPGAFIHSEARLESDVTVDPGVVIGPKVEIGTGTIIGANSVIGPQVRIGRNCAIGAHVTIACALIGNAVTIHPGVRIGQDGSTALASPAEGEIAWPGLGRVIIQDAAHVGANATIDRGGLGDTVLGEGCRIGNLVRVARGHWVGRGEVLNA